jgi:hypothetical protein
MAFCRAKAGIDEALHKVSRRVIVTMNWKELKYCR